MDYEMQALSDARRKRRRLKLNKEVKKTESPEKRIEVQQSLHQFNIVIKKSAILDDHEMDEDYRETRAETKDITEEMKSRAIKKLRSTEAPQVQSCQDVQMTDETKVQNIEIQNKILWLQNRVKNQNLLKGFPYETDLEQCKNEPELVFWAIVMRNNIDNCPLEIMQ